MKGIPTIEDVMSPGTGVHIEYIDYRGRKLIHEARILSMDQTTLCLGLSSNAFKYLTDIRVHQMKIPIICKCNSEPRDLVFFTELNKLHQTSSAMAVARPAAFVLGRSFTRYEVNLPFSYFLDGVEFSGCKMANLSFGGLSGIVKSNPMLKLGMEIVCQIKFPATSPEYIVGQIIRLEDRELHSRISIKFEEMTTDVENKIAQYFSSISRKTSDP